MRLVIAVLVIAIPAFVLGSRARPLKSSVGVTVGCLNVALTGVPVRMSLVRGGASGRLTVAEHEVAWTVLER